MATNTGDAIKRSNKRSASEVLNEQLCALFGADDVVAEHRFCTERRWRFDFAILSRMIAVEIEGGVFIGGRHTRGAGYAGDMLKYNTATCYGWRILRFTPSQITNGTAIETVKKLL